MVITIFIIVSHEKPLSLYTTICFFLCSVLIIAIVYSIKSIKCRDRRSGCVCVSVCHISCTAHDTGLLVLDGALHRFFLLLLFLCFLQECLIHCELYGIGCWPGSQVIHPSLQSLHRSVCACVCTNYINLAVWCYMHYLGKGETL